MSPTVKLPSLRAAIQSLCSGIKIQSGKHIRPLNSYCAARLVAEGGFPPAWVSPRPPLTSRQVSNTIHNLDYSAGAQAKSEIRVLGGIKYKNVDVTVVVPNVGPALAVSAKNTGNAFRNLTNRMEEALGECTNVHLMYPGFVFGFLHLIKYSKESEVPKPDASFAKTGEPLPAIKRYHEVLISLSGRSTITDPGMRYEAVGLLVYTCEGDGAKIWNGYPPVSSPVHFSRFFQRLYDIYDLRFAYPDPDGPNIRKGWRSSDFSSTWQADRDLGFPWGLRTAED